MKDLPAHTPEERAIQLILNAKIETDDDYLALTKLIDDTIADEFLDDEK